MSTSNLVPVQAKQSSALATAKSSAIAGYNPGSIEEYITVGQILAKSGYFGDNDSRMTEQQAVVKMLRGAELGIPPVAAIENIYVIDGKTSISASLIAARIKSSKRYDYRIREWTAKNCEIEFFEITRSGKESLGVYGFSIDEARQAKLGSSKDAKYNNADGFNPYSNWAKYPKKMLFARCITQGADAYCPDVFMGGVEALEEVEDRQHIQDPFKGNNFDFKVSEEWASWQMQVNKIPDIAKISTTSPDQQRAFLESEQSKLLSLQQNGFDFISSGQWPAIAKESVLREVERASDRINERLTYTPKAEPVTQKPAKKTKPVNEEATALISEVFEILGIPANERRAYIQAAMVAVGISQFEDLTGESLGEAIKNILCSWGCLVNSSELDPDGVPIPMYLSPGEALAALEDLILSEVQDPKSVDTSGWRTISTAWKEQNS